MSEEEKPQKPKSKAQEKREKRANKLQLVNLPVAGETELNIPAYFITQSKKGKWRLLDPITTSRNLSSSTGETSIKITKKTILKPVLGDINELPKEELPKLKDFSKKDREKIETLMSSIHKGENKVIEKKAGKTRGRPIYLYKNAKIAGYRKVKNLKSYGMNPTQNPKKQKEDEEEEDEEEDEEKDMTGKRGRRKSPYLSVKQQEDELKKTYNALKKEKKTLMKVSPNALHKSISELIGREKRLREDFAVLKEKFFNDMKDKGLVGEGIIEKIKDIGHKVFHGRNDYPPSFKRLLDKYGNETVSRVEVYRQPILSVFSTILNLTTKGEAERRLKETDKDKLFHISLWATLSNGKTLLIEKNETLNMKENPNKVKESETIEAPTPPANLTLREMIEKTKERMGDKFFTYRALDNNCGNFIENILQANDMDSPPVMDFIKQDAKKILEGFPRLAKAMNLITDIAGRANVLVEGGEIKKNIKMNVILKKKSHINIQGKGMISQFKPKKSLIKPAVMSPEDLAKHRTLPFRPQKPSHVLSVGYGLHPALVSPPMGMVYHPNAMTIIHHNHSGMGLYASGLYGHGLGAGLYGYGLGAGMEGYGSSSESEEEEEEEEEKPKTKGGRIPAPPSRSTITDPPLMGSGLKGRPKKGSPEAKAWGEKMRALRKK